MLDLLSFSKIFLSPSHIETSQTSKLRDFEIDCKDRECKHSLRPTKAGDVLDMSTPSRRAQPNGSKEMPFTEYGKAPYSDIAKDREEQAILVIGPSGAGKSTLIQKATGSTSMMIGNGLSSGESICTYWNIL